MQHPFFKYYALFALVFLGLIILVIKEFLKRKKIDSVYEYLSNRLETIRKEQKPNENGHRSPADLMIVKGDIVKYCGDFTDDIWSAVDSKRAK